MDPFFEGICNLVSTITVYFLFTVIGRFFLGQPSSCMEENPSLNRLIFQEQRRPYCKILGIKLDVIGVFLALPKFIEQGKKVFNKIAHR